MSELTLERRPDVAKRQRSVVLDENIAQMVDAFQEGTGATFARIISAALLQYFLDSPLGPDPKWMACAMGLERGDLAIPEIPRRHMNQKREAEQSVVDRLPDVQVVAPAWRSDEGIKTTALGNLESMIAEDALWKSILKKTDSPMDSIIEFLRSNAKRK